MEHSLDEDALKEQNMQLKIENKERMIQNNQQKIDTAQNFLQKYAEEKLLYLGETEIESNIVELLTFCTKNNDEKVGDRKECIQEI